jgi:HSP20 family protein
MSNDDDNDDFAAGAIRGLTSFLEKLAKLAEEGGNIEKSSNFETSKGFKGVWGINVKTGIGGDSNGGGSSKPNFVVEPFGTHVEEDDRGHVVVDPVREPPIDVFDEDDHVLIVAEMPGIEAEDVTLDIEGDVFQLRAERGDRRFRKELLLPRAVDADKTTVRAENGIVEIRCHV